MRCATARNSRPTMHAVRQFISHGHVKVNGRRVSSILASGSRSAIVVEVKEKSKELPILLEALQLGRARRSRLRGSRPQENDRKACARAGSFGRALSRADGSRTGRRILFAIGDLRLLVKPPLRVDQPHLGRTDDAAMGHPHTGERSIEITRPEVEKPDSRGKRGAMS